MSKPSLNSLIERLKAAEAAGRSSNASAPHDGTPPTEPSQVVAAARGVGAAPAAPSLDSTEPAAAPISAGSPPVPDAPAAKTSEGPPGGLITRPGESPQQLQERIRTLKVRTFVTELLRPENKYNATQAYLKAFAQSDCTVESARTLASRLLAEVDVIAEINRQLRGIEAHADLDEDYVYRHWRAIAESDLFEVFAFDKDGRCTGFKVHPDEMTKEQRLAIRELEFRDDGSVKKIKLVDRERAIENIAKARKMYMAETESGTALQDFAGKLTEKLRQAEKRAGRTFDGITGEQVA